MVSWKNSLRAIKLNFQLNSKHVKHLFVKVDGKRWFQ